MNNEDFCQGCHQKHNCQEIYQRLSNSNCPSVTLSVVKAFLIPILVFIISEAIFLRIFQFKTGSAGLSSNNLFMDSQSFMTILGFSVSALMAVLSICLIQLLNKKHKNKLEYFNYECSSKR